MQYRRYRYLNDLMSSGQTETFKGPEVPDGMVLEITSMMVTDRTTADKLLRVGMLDQDDNLHDFDLNDGDRAFAARLRGQAWLEEGEHPAGIVTDATANDYCSFSVHGRLWLKEEVGAAGAKVQ